MLAGFESGCDFPMSAYPEEMLAAFPDAKFVLTVRPAEQWWSSISSSICWFKLEGNRPLQVLTRLPFFPFNRIKQQMPMMDAMVRHKFARDDAALDSWTAMCAPPNRERTMTAFDAHTERVKQLIPRERLLVFEAGKNSYAELASFLGVDAPEEAVPAHQLQGGVRRVGQRAHRRRRRGWSSRPSSSSCAVSAASEAAGGPQGRMRRRA